MGNVVPLIFKTKEHKRTAAWHLNCFMICETSCVNLRCACISSWHCRGATVVVSTGCWQWLQAAATTNAANATMPCPSIATLERLLHGSRWSLLPLSSWPDWGLSTNNQIPWCEWLGTNRVSPLVLTLWKPCSGLTAFWHFVYSGTAQQNILLTLHLSKSRDLVLFANDETPHIKLSFAPPDPDWGHSMPPW